ncbi:MAG TPA: OmpA family protein [Kofleriaceae bacterium]|jgi:outer membrane protein OmpA-like peptidoglycan-associated protein
MRFKIVAVSLLSLAAGCFKANGPETCQPVPTSWGPPTTRCEAIVVAKAPPPPPPPEPVPVAEPAPAPPPPKTELTDDEIKLKEKIEFETDSAKILPQSTGILDEVVQVMKDHPEIERVRVGGHTDSTSTKKHNQKLSEDRAASVKQYLIDHGVEAERVSSKGFGETRPIADNKTEEGRAQNRRVEIRIGRKKGEKDRKLD